MKRKQVDVWVITNHWGEYDYQGVTILGIYNNYDDNAMNKLERLQTHLDAEKNCDPYAENNFLRIEKQTAILEESCLNNV